MITKSLDELIKERENYEQELNACKADEEKEVIKKAFVNNLRFYLFETKAIIKEFFQVEITPFTTGNDGYDGLLRKNNNINSITKKTKEDFYKDIDNLLNSSIYSSLNDEQKKKVDLAFFVLKTYYQDELV